MPGSYDQPPPHGKSDGFSWLTRERLITWGITGFMLLAGAGWVLWPAKDRDLQDLKANVQQLDARITSTADRLDAMGAKIERGFEKISDKLDLLKEGQQANREEIIRLTAGAKEPVKGEPKPVIAVKRRTSAAKPDPKPAEPVPPVKEAGQKLPSILDSLFN